MRKALGLEPAKKYRVPIAWARCLIVLTLVSRLKHSIDLSGDGSGWLCILLRVPRPLCGLLLDLRKTHSHPDPGDPRRQRSRAKSLVRRDGLGLCACAEVKGEPEGRRTRSASTQPRHIAGSAIQQAGQAIQGVSTITQCIPRHLLPQRPTPRYSPP